jgi:cell division protein FtsQ
MAVAKPRRGTAPERRGGAGARVRSGWAAALPVLKPVAVGAAIAAVVLAAYLVARDTSVFAVRTLDVHTGSPRVRSEVTRALAPETGRSLLRIDEGALTRRLEALPDVLSAKLERSFPSTLEVTVDAERAVLLVRQGAASWVVSARGRVMRKVGDPRRSRLPRLWLPKSVQLAAGETLPLDQGRMAAAAVAPIVSRGYPGGVRTVVSANEALTLVLGGGTELRLGDLGDLRLKLAIARKILRVAAANGDTTPAYVDVSVPERPVLAAQKP